jgi:hypothetical protein
LVQARGEAAEIALRAAPGSLAQAEP